MCPTDAVPGRRSKTLGPSPKTTKANRWRTSKNSSAGHQQISTEDVSHLRTPKAEIQSSSMDLIEAIKYHQQNQRPSQMFERNRYVKHVGVWSKWRCRKTVSSAVSAQLQLWKQNMSDVSTSNFSQLQRIGNEWGSHFPFLMSNKWPASKWPLKSIPVHLVSIHSKRYQPRKKKKKIIHHRWESSSISKNPVRSDGPSITHLITIRLHVINK